MNQPAVEVVDLVMRYGSVTAVDGLNLTVEQGTVTAILGPNGAGKTTTIETCEGFRTPQSGTVRVLGLDPIADGRKLKPRVGVMLQSGGAWSGARAYEMLRHIASLHAHPLDVDQLIERLGMHGYGSTPYRRLSGGQQQRLSLAMAIVGRPELLFLDEPTAGLDPQARHATWDLVVGAARQRRDDGADDALHGRGRDAVRSGPHRRRRARSSRPARPRRLPHPAPRTPSVSPLAPVSTS